jgi:mitogen-activated protein kinase 1/3
MLRYNPVERITIEEALNHEFIGDLHYEPDEPTTVPVSAFDFDFELFDLSIEEQKSLIHDEIMLYHSRKAQKKYVSNKKKYPNGMLHLVFGDYKPQKKSNSEDKSEPMEKNHVENSKTASETVNLV